MVSVKKVTWFLIGAILLSGCKEEEVVKEQEEIVRPVKLTTVEMSDTQYMRTFTGEVIASNTTELSFKVSGQLEALNVVEGDMVKKGDVIAKIDPTDFQIQVDLAKANYDLAKAQYERTKTAAAKKAATASQLDEARAGLSQAEINLKNARNQLRYTSLLAPYDGTVGEINIEAGEFVSAARAVLTVLDLNTIDLEFRVPSDVATGGPNRPKEYYSPKIRFEPWPQQVYDAQLKGFVVSPDPGTKSYLATLTMALPDDIPGQILPGMRVSMDLNMAQIIDVPSNNILVPAEAIFVHGGNEIASNEKQVWVYQNGMVSLTNVTIGNVSDDQIEVLKGLQPGDQVVIAGVHSIHDGQKVKPWSESVKNGGQ